MFRLILQFELRILLWWVKDQQTHHSFNVLVLNILLHVSAFQNAIIRDSDMNMLRWCPMSWKAEKDGSCILWQTVWWSEYYPDLSFSAFHDIGNHLSMFISESLIMAFQNAETCRNILSTNTVNEWCICWSFTHRVSVYLKPSSGFNLKHRIYN
jgi:hypothetical protein